MNEFIVYSSLLLGILVLYMLNRPKNRPSRLKLRDPSEKHNSDARALKPSFEDGGTPSESRELNVIFQFNGHSFEAFEVLGLPAGSSREQVEVAYRSALQNSDSESQELLRLAYQALAKKMS